ncbi:MAG: O-antigen ligase family protein [Elusimicrobiota bacterium]
MPEFVVAALAGAGPLLRGSWDLWAQSALFFISILVLGFWILRAIAAEALPSPNEKALVWFVALSLWCGFCAALSPVRFYCLPVWRWTILGLAIFPLMSVIPEPKRARIDHALRASGWLAALAVFYQRLRYGMPSPPGVFPNPNVMAAAALLWIGIAWQDNDWFLTAAMILILFWERSVGAWLALAAAGILERKNLPKILAWSGLAALAAAVAALGIKLRTHAAVHRLQWWSAAARMALNKPILGFGPGSFAYVFSAYRRPSYPLGSFYAHEGFLETAAGCGIAYAAVWTIGIWLFLRKASLPKRVAATAFFFQTFWDYPLSIPGLFWLFCYVAADGVEKSNRQAVLPVRWKLPVAALTLATVLILNIWAFAAFRGDQWKARAIAAAKNGAAAGVVSNLLRRSERFFLDPESEELLAEEELSPQKGLKLNPNVETQALGHLENAVAANPYRCQTWIEKIEIEENLEDRGAAARTLARAQEFCPQFLGKTLKSL